MFLLNANWKPTWDSATYIMLGKSLITGHGFKYMDIPHTKYPFMFPLMLCPIVGLLGRNFLMMRLMIVSMALGSIGLTFWLFKRSFGLWLGLGVMLMTAASYPLMIECTRILSDVPYMLLSLLSLIFIRRYAQDEKWKGKFGYISAGLILASFLTRYIGMALFGGTVIYLLVDSKGDMSLRLRKIALISLIFLIPASLWMVRGAVFRKTSPPPPGLREFLSYEKELVIVNPGDPHSGTLSLSNFVSRVRVNTPYYQDLAADIIRGKDARSRGYIRAITILLLCGFVYCLVKWRGVFEYYVFFYVLIYIVWTSLQGHRFLVPIIPFIFYYLIRALLLVPHFLSLFIKRLGDNYRILGERIIIAGLVAMAVHGNWSSDVNIIRAERRKPYYAGSMSDFLNVIEWIKNNTEPDAVIVSGRAPYVYMLSERKTFSPVWVNNTDEVMASIRETNASYIINGPALHSSSFLSPLLQEQQNTFLKIYAVGDSVVYRVVD
jgi:dolichyl-phosphate-mannose-protein mannosyltransferase